MYFNDPIEICILILIDQFNKSLTLPFISYQVIRGQSQVGEVPANYRCFKCRKPGHWIKNCPLSSNGDANDFKRNTGIPRSFIERDAQDK